ncbi:MAG: flavodoxin [Anaerovoracaceae bacterium]
MKKVAVVYWSGTGNTEAMAISVADGAKAKGADVSLFTSGDFNADMVKDYDSIAFGCPSMGDEVLEESEFQPMFDTCKGKLGGKKVALFGSYGWGDGEWMRNWEAECADLGVDMACDPVICNEMPDDSGKAECQSLGASLA